MTDHADEIKKLKQEDTFVAYVDRVKFQNKDDNFYIADLSVGNMIIPSKFTSFSSVVEGLGFNCEGYWGTYQGDDQFIGKKMHAFIPTDKHQLALFLSKSMGGISYFDIKTWIGKAPDDQNFIDLDIDALKLLGVPEKTAERITEFVKAFKTSDSASQLQEWGLKDEAIKLIMAAFSPLNPVDEIKKNPYQIISFSGVKFEDADAIGKEIGFAKNDPRRIGAAMFDIMRWHESNGHAYYPADGTVAEAMRMLGIPGKEIIAAVKSGQATGVTLEKSRLYSDANLHAEKTLSKIIAKRVVEKKPWMTVTDKEIINIGLAVTGFKLTDDQVRAVQGMTKSHFSILVGGAGTGKTVVEAVLVGLIKAKGLKAHVVAPTGKAAKRAEEVSGVPAETVHRAFGFTGSDWQVNADSPMVDVDVLSLDEFSMLTTDLSFRVLSGISDDVPMLMFGDHNQLEAIGAGKIAYALTHSDDVNVQRLTEIKRTTGVESGINHNAYRILAKEELEPTDDVHVYVRKRESEQIALLLERSQIRLDEVVGQGRMFDPIKDFQVLTPMNKGGLGIHALNPRLRKIFNPTAALVQERMDAEAAAGENPIYPDDVFPRSNGTFFMKGDKIMKMTENDKESDLYNGDVGIVLRSYKDGCEVQIGDRTLLLARKDLRSFEFAYAMTIHKSQGSEYKNVLAVINSSHKRMFSNNLVYTMETRAKETFDVIHDGTALDEAINTDPAPRYCTFGARLDHQISLLRKAKLENERNNSLEMT